MTPKAKAENLIEKFIPNTRIWNDEKKVWEDCVESAKRCALIVVDETLNEYPSQCPKDSYEMERHIFWQEVKQELLNMK